MTLLRHCPRHGNYPQNSRCPDCQRERQQRRGTTTARGYGTTWQKLAKQAIALQPWCSVCGTAEDLTVDHRDPRTRGRDDLTLADVDVLCRPHNSSKGAGGGQAVDATDNISDPSPPFRETHMLVG